MEQLQNYIDAIVRTDWVTTAISAVVILAITAVVARLTRRFLGRVLAINEERDLPSSSIFINIARGAVWITGVCIMLSTCFRVDVSAAITALGIGGIAISLGFQDTLSNLIGGLQVSLLRIIKPGDNIEVGSSTGVVKDITWRHTTIRNGAGAAAWERGAIVSEEAMKTMSETRLTEGPLHHLDGKLAECGWATSLLRAYDRDRIKAPKRRIKEWDYYLVNDDEFAVALTVADMGYVGLISASVMDFAQATSHTASVISPFPMGRFKLPATSAEGVTSFENNRVSFRFEVAGGQRRLNVWFAGFDGGDDLTFEAVLDEEPRDSMVISTPWAEDPLAFYYNQKIVAMQARGSFKKGLLVHGFCPENSFGLLDWGRGVWTRDNTWYWAVAQGWQDGRRFGLNLGYGFGDTSAASENMVFIDGAAHKLHRVDFGIPEKTGGAHAKKTADRYQLMQPWHMTDDEGRLDLVFTPLLDRVDWMDFKLIRSDQHQVFGRFDGAVTLDDGSTLLVENLLGSAEVIHNVY